MSGLLTYDRLRTGQMVGEASVRLDAPWIADYAAIFGPVDTTDLPRGVILSAVMRGAIRAFGDAPDGSVHAGQTLSFTNLKLAEGDVLDIAVSCGPKQPRGGRLWVDFDLRVARAGDPVAEGAMTALWAR